MDAGRRGRGGSPNKSRPNRQLKYGNHLDKSAQVARLHDPPPQTRTSRVDLSRFAGKVFSLIHPCTAPRCHSYIIPTPNTHVTRVDLSRFAGKVFSLLHSSFSEALLLDCDNIPFTGGFGRFLIIFRSFCVGPVRRLGPSSRRDGRRGRARAGGGRSVWQGRRPSTATPPSSRVGGVGSRVQAPPPPPHTEPLTPRPASGKRPRPQRADAHKPHPQKPTRPAPSHTHTHTHTPPPHRPGSAL